MDCFNRIETLVLQATSFVLFLRFSIDAFFSCCTLFIIRCTQERTVRTALGKQYGPGILLLVDVQIETQKNARPPTHSRLSLSSSHANTHDSSFLCRCRK